MEQEGQQERHDADEDAVDEAGREAQAETAGLTTGERAGSGRVAGLLAVGAGRRWRGYPPGGPYGCAGGGGDSRTVARWDRSHPLSSDRSCRSRCDQSTPVCTSCTEFAAARPEVAAQRFLRRLARDRAVSASSPPCCAARSLGRSRRRRRVGAAVARDVGEVRGQFGARLRAASSSSGAPARRPPGRAPGRARRPPAGHGRVCRPVHRPAASNSSRAGSRTPHRTPCAPRAAAPAQGRLARGVGRRDDQSAEQADVGEEFAALLRLSLPGPPRTRTCARRGFPESPWRPGPPRRTAAACRSPAATRRRSARRRWPWRRSRRRSAPWSPPGRAASADPREPDGRRPRRAWDSGARRFPDR